MSYQYQTTFQTLNYGTNPYELNIVSQHSQFRGKTLKKFNLNGTDHVGVWGSEPFEILFKNNTYNKVQVRLSIDGTDILTGKLASTEPGSDMWVVKPHETLRLKAWPETTKGGAQFVFTSADKSVAVNTHGDVSNQSIIAAAVYVEGEPVNWFINNNLTYVGPVLTPAVGTFISPPSGSADHNFRYKSVYTSGSSTNTGTLSFNGTATSYNSASPASYTAGTLESTAGVGAGTAVAQNLNYVTGLNKPILQQIVTVRYVWWDELKAALKDSSAPIQVNGFPADNRKLMDLGTTPRLNNAKPPVFAQEFNRV